MASHPMLGQLQQALSDYAPHLPADLASKVVHTLIEGMDSSELVEICNSPPLLLMRVAEALDVLSQHGATTPAAGGLAFAPAAGGSASASLASPPLWANRIRKEIQAAQKLQATESFPSHVSLRMLDDSYAVEGVIEGPPDTPFAGGEWLISIAVPPNYPFSSPTFKMLTPVWHPQISQSGEICASWTDQWSPATTLRAHLLSVVSALGSPDVDTPMNAEAAAQLSRDPKDFAAQALAWTRLYATKGKAREPSVSNEREWALLCAAHGVAPPPRAPLSRVVMNPAFRVAEDALACIIRGELADAASDTALAECVIPVLLRVVSAETIVDEDVDHCRALSDAASARFGVGSEPTRLGSFHILVNNVATTALTAIQSGAEIKSPATPSASTMMGAAPRGLSPFELVGKRVRRGPTWAWGGQDEYGGQRVLGTIKGCGSSAATTVAVLWDIPNSSVFIYPYEPHAHPPVLDVEIVANAVSSEPTMWAKEESNVSFEEARLAEMGGYVSLAASGGAAAPAQPDEVPAPASAHISALIQFYTAHPNPKTPDATAAAQIVWDKYGGKVWERLRVKYGALDSEIRGLMPKPAPAPSAASPSAGSSEADAEVGGANKTRSPSSDAVSFAVEFMCSCLDVLQQLLPRPRRSLIAQSPPPPSRTLLALADLASGACGSALWAALETSTFGKALFVKEDASRARSGWSLEFPSALAHGRLDEFGPRSAALFRSFQSFWTDAQAFADDGGGLNDASTPAFATPKPFPSPTAQAPPTSPGPAFPSAAASHAAPKSAVDSQAWLGQSALEHVLASTSLGLDGVFSRVRAGEMGSGVERPCLPLEILRAYAEYIGTTESLLVAFARCEDARASAEPRAQTGSTRVVVNALPPAAFFLPSHAFELFSHIPQNSAVTASVNLPSENHVSGWCKQDCTQHAGAVCVRDAQQLTEPVGLVAEFFNDDGGALRFISALPDSIGALASSGTDTPNAVSRDWLSLLRSTLGLSQGRSSRAQLDKIFSTYARTKMRSRSAVCASVARSAARLAVETDSVDAALRALEVLTLLPRSAVRDKGLEADARALVAIAGAAFPAPAAVVASADAAEALSVEQALSALAVTLRSTGLPFAFSVSADPTFTKGACVVCGCEVRFSDDGGTQVCKCQSCAHTCLHASNVARAPALHTVLVDDASLARDIDALYSGTTAAAARARATELVHHSALRTLAAEVGRSAAPAELVPRLRPGLSTLRALAQALAEGKLAGLLRAPLLALLSALADRDEFVPLLVASTAFSAATLVETLPVIFGGRVLAPGSILGALNSGDDGDIFLGAAAEGKAGAAVAAAIAAVSGVPATSHLAEVRQRVNQSALAWVQSQQPPQDAARASNGGGAAAASDGGALGGASGGGGAPLPSPSQWNPDLAQQLSVSDVLGTAAASTSGAVLPPRSKRAQSILVRRRAGISSVDDYFTASRKKRDEYATAMLDHAFGEMETLSARSAFKSQPKPSLTPAPKGLMKLIRELTRFSEESSTTTWDSSIAVRVDASRMDILRAVIIPNISTPYANAILVFDIFVPQEYPAVPPKVQYLTTGGGGVRVNPNLYNEGKVCLSLLGTWQGPGWDPAVSSLSQVLLSIQSYVLNNLPIQQEPGHEAHTTSDYGRLKCARHNADVRLAILRHGILDPLLTPPLGFEELAETHFRLKAFEIEAQVIRWAEEAVLMARLEIEVERWANPAYVKILTDSLPKSAPIFAEVHARASAMKSHGEWTAGTIMQRVHSASLKGPPKNNPRSIADLCAMLSALRPADGAARGTMPREYPFAAPAAAPAAAAAPSSPHVGLTRANSLGGDSEGSGGAESQLALRLSRLSESLRSLLLSGTRDASTLAAAVDASTNVERAVSVLRANASGAVSFAHPAVMADELSPFSDERIVSAIGSCSVFWTASATIVAADDILRLLEVKKWLGETRTPPLAFAETVLTAARAAALAQSARARRSGFSSSGKAVALRKAESDAIDLVAARFSSDSAGFAVVGSLATGAATLSSDVDIVVFPGGAHTEAAKVRKMSAIVCGILGAADAPAPVPAPPPPADAASATTSAASTTSAVASSAEPDTSDSKALAGLVSTAVAPLFTCDFVFDHKASGKQHIQLTHVETGVHVDLVSTDKDKAAVAQRTAAVKLFVESEPLLADLHSLLNDALGLTTTSRATSAVCKKHAAVCPPVLHGCPYRDAASQKLTGHAVLLLSRMVLRTPPEDCAAGGGGGAAAAAAEASGSAQSDGHALFRALSELADADAFLARLTRAGHNEFELDELPKLGGTMRVLRERVTELCGVASSLRDALASGKALEFCLTPPPLAAAEGPTLFATTPGIPSFAPAFGDAANSPPYSPTSPAETPTGGKTPLFSPTSPVYGSAPAPTFGAVPSFGAPAAAAPQFGGANSFGWAAAASFAAVQPVPSFGAPAPSGGPAVPSFGSPASAWASSAPPAFGLAPPPPPSAFGAAPSYAFPPLNPFAISPPAPTDPAVTAAVNAAVNAFSSPFTFS